MLELKKFDDQYYESLQDKDAIIIDPEGYYKTIYVNNKKAGVVGIIKSNFENDEAFIQIIVSKEFRGQGLVKKAEDLICKEYNIKKLYATISTNNVASIKAHKNIGFKEIKPKLTTELKGKGCLLKTQVRLEKIID